MSYIKAKNYLEEHDLDSKIMEFNVSTATVKEAALAIVCLEDEIAKSLAFIVNDKPILIIVSGNSEISNSKYMKELL